MRHALFLVFLLHANLLLASRAENNAPGIVSHIPRQFVGSSALVSVGYSKRLHSLEVEFTNGAVYRYLEVPSKVYRNLMEAESKARFYDVNIRGHYSSVHVRARPSE